MKVHLICEQVHAIADLSIQPNQSFTGSDFTASVLNNPTELKAAFKDSNAASTFPGSKLYYGQLHNKEA